ncbi:MAG: S4 domain-containing protein, partial [Gemmatimonadota bacterium]|nr:S4 domain-containing protein [Gemmatimonadota bacterium]
PERRHAQRMLAEDVTARVHGGEALAKAQDAAAALFSSQGLSAEQVIEADMPEIELFASDFGEGLSVVDLLVRAGLASSKAEARRGIEQKGYYVDNEAITDATRRVTLRDLTAAGGVRLLVLRKGKRNYVRVVVR